MECKSSRYDEFIKHGQFIIKNSSRIFPKIPVWRKQRHRKAFNNLLPWPFRAGSKKCKTQISAKTSSIQSNLSNVHFCKHEKDDFLSDLLDWYFASTKKMTFCQIYSTVPSPTQLEQALSIFGEHTTTVNERQRYPL